MSLRARFEAICRELARPPAVDSLGVESLGKRYGETVALENVDLRFRPGDVHTILGENGSGKSTLLKLLSGVARPSTGRVVLNGRTLRGGSPQTMQRLGIGTVFQEVLIAPHLSLGANVLLGCDGLLRRRIPRSRRHALAREALATISDAELDLTVPAGGLPLATQQLVVIARALVKLPSVLLLDEATAALDLGDRDRVFDTVSEYAEAGNVVIFVSHRMDEVERLSDRVSVLRSGALVETLDRDAVSAERLLRLMAPHRRAG